MRAGRGRTWLVTAGGVAAALPMCLYLWGFMVDDALIIARYASHLGAGQGHRFNLAGPVTDGVTPLPFALLLAPVATDVWGAFRAAKLLGLLAWLIGTGVLAVAVDGLRLPRRKWAGWALLAASAPLGAWSVAGMETGLVAGLAALAAASRALGRERLVAISAGLVAALRPEALPWAVVLAVAPPLRARSADGRRTRRWRAVLWAAGPAAAVAALRLAVFGRPTPLALLAKPPELRHGLVYAAACLLLTGPVALLAWRGLPPWVRGLQVATAVHFAALVSCGGDWMPLSRLAVPVLPCVVLASCAIVGSSKLRWGAGRLAPALAGELFVVATVGPRASVVQGTRAAVIAQLAPTLRRCARVATLDVGWVGASTGASVLDLAGVTDPAVAALPGGHTTKRVPPALLEARQVDCLVLLLGRGEQPATRWHQSRFARGVEQRVARLTAGWGFAPVGLSTGPLGYMVVRRNTTH